MTVIGKTISHYNILEELGRGGMGVVYKAQDTKLRRPVALKFLPPRMSLSEKDRRRFIQEAQAASALNHPNVCTIHDIQEHDSPASLDAPAGKQLFIVMEYVEGRTLRDIMRSQHGDPLAVRQAVDIGIQIADGLAAAHLKGIVHRDIKPENIMVRKDGIVQIMDFGVAMLISSGDVRLTEEGAMVGTAGYASPEQLQGQDTDHRSDIFSLGVLLFELLAGRLPFKGVHDAALTYEIVNVNPPHVSSLRPGIEPELDRIVMECMQKDPADRFQSSAEVAKELRRVRHTLDHSRGSPRLPQGKQEVIRGGSQAQFLSPFGLRWLARVALLGVAIGLIAVGFFFWKPWGSSNPQPQPVARFTLSLPSGSSLDLRRNGLALSPDGKHLAVIVRQDSGSRLLLRGMDQFDMHPVAVATGLNVSSPFFSPDGQWLGFFANGKLMKLSLRGGDPVTICDGAPVWGDASWGEGGNIVFMKEWGSHLWIVSSEAGSVPRPLTTLHPEAGERAHLLPRVLPGGKEALFTIWRGGDFNDNLIASVDLNSGEYHTVLTGGTGGSYIKAGHLVYVLGSTLMAVPFDAKGLTVTGESLPVIDNVLMNGGFTYPFFAVSENGTLAYAPGAVEFVPAAIKIVEHGSAIQNIESGKVNLGFPAFSPSGSALSVVIPGPTYQVGVYDLRRGVLTPLTFAGDNVRHVWLPDGQRIAYSSNVAGRYEIYTVPADGSGSPQKLFDQDGNPYPASWSNDSKNLAYVVANKETGSDIWIYSNANARETRPLLSTRANELDPMFSPNGHWLAYVSDESGENEVYVQPFPSMAGRWRATNGGGTTPQWSPDGHRVFFQRNDEILSVPVAVTNDQKFAIGREERYLVCPGLISFSLSPHGKTVVISQAKPGTYVDRVNIVLNWYGELRRKSGSPEVTTVR